MFKYKIAVKILTMVVTFVTFVTLFQNIEIECNGLLPSLPCFKGEIHIKQWSMVWYPDQPCYSFYGRHRFYTEFEALVKFKIGRVIITFVRFHVYLGYRFAEVENCNIFLPFG